MDLFLVAPEFDLTLELPVPPELSDSVSRFLIAVEHGSDPEEFCARLSRELGRVIPDLIDWHHKPPTKAQIAFAQTLCRRLGLSLPAKAKESRGEMHRFLEANAPRLAR